MLQYLFSSRPLASFQLIFLTLLFELCKFFRLSKEDLQTKMILQVHDELVFDVLKEELKQVQEIVVYEMKNAIPGLRVPLEVGLGSGNNWLEAH